jgi:hypothetical protein
MWLGELFQDGKKVEFENIASHIFTNALPSICNFHRIASWGKILSCSWPKLRPYDVIDATVSVLPIAETSSAALRICNALSRH